MPRYDGTGPQGQGPMTGRGMGFCGVRVPGIQGLTRWAPMGALAWNGVRRFMGWGRRGGAGGGRGAGFGRMFGPR